MWKAEKTRIMNSVGLVALYIAPFFAIYSVFALAVGLARRSRAALASGRWALVAVFVLVSVAAGALIWALASRDFGVRYVAQYTSRDLPLFYTISAFWAGQEGSLLLWLWLVSLFACIVLTSGVRRRVGVRFISAVALTIGVAELFFASLVARIANPLITIPHPPLDGQGLNPLLQDPGMIFHPPILYLGYVGYVVPFAFAVAALLLRREIDEWPEMGRRWSLFSWVALTAGIALGMKWSYVELGWGGYWAWDPVENASLIPWFVGTAFLHSAAVQRRTGALKGWNVALAALTFEGCIFGTFLTRSGVLSSVHAFAGSSLGPYFIGFMLLSVSAVLAIGMWRADALRGELRTGGLFSWESLLVLNNWLFSALAFATLVGTTFPLFSQAFAGSKISVSAPFFDRVNTPIALLLLLLTGVCTLIPWRRTGLAGIPRSSLWAAGFSLAAGVGAALVFDVRSPYRFICVAGSALIVASVLAESARAAMVRCRKTGGTLLTASVQTIWRDRRRFGGYLVHIGVASIFIGILGSSVFEYEVQKSIVVGEEVGIGEYRVRLEEIVTTERLNAQLITTRLSVKRGERHVATLEPAQAFYPTADSPMTEVAIRSTLAGDLYTIFGGVSEDGHVALKLHTKPLVSWIWYGSWLVVLGGVFALTDRVRLGNRRRRESIASGVG